MQHAGNLRKMKTQLAKNVQYALPLGTELVNMNALIGSEINLDFSGTINCKLCGRKTKKSFAQGFCYPCFQNAPENSPCIIRPELCESHLGKGRNPEWEKKHHYQPHVVYLASSGGLKVGVTRADQVPTRWLDQGARKAIKLSETPHRQIAGLIETELKQHISDRTDWRKMLKNLGDDDINLLEAKQRMTALLPIYLANFQSPDDAITHIEYPVLRYPEKVKSVNFDKTPHISGKLAGIKGQYLIFDDDRVLNLRKHAGYFITLGTN